MATASSIAASASSRRPRSASRTDRLFSDAGQVGPERVRAGRGQLPADGDGFLDRGQRLLPPPQVGQPDRQVVQRRGQVGPERVRAGRGQLPVDARRLPRSRPAPPPAAPGRPAGPTGCSATWPGRAGTRPGGPRPAPGRCRRLPRSRPAPPPAAPGRPAGPTGCSATWPGRAGTRPGGPRPAPGGWSTASSIAASASSRRPRSASRTDRLFSDMARSGRNASGRAAASSRRMVTASSIAASASSRRPRSASRTDRLFSDVARSGRNASGRAAASSR